MARGDGEVDGEHGFADPGRSEQGHVGFGLDEFARGEIFDLVGVQAGLSIYFTTLDDLVRRLRAAEATGRFNRQLQAFLRPSVLVVDEVGYLPLDRAEANMVFQLVSRRYERGTMIITSNKSFTEWGGVLGDDVLATAILDRLLHHCDVININGPSYRLTLVAGGEPMT